jgi:hypothetical protein
MAVIFPYRRAQDGEVVLLYSQTSVAQRSVFRAEQKTPTPTCFVRLRTASERSNRASHMIVCQVNDRRAHEHRSRRHAPDDIARSGHRRWWRD